MYLFGRLNECLQYYQIMNSMEGSVINFILISLLFKKFYWSIVDLQCCAHFCDSIIHIHILSHFLFQYFNIIGYWTLFPVLYRRTLWFIHPLYASLHLLISNSQCFPAPHPLPLGNHKSISVRLFLSCRYAHLCHSLDSIYKWYHMVFVFLFLTYFT